MIGVGPTLDRIDTRVDVVSRGGTHGSGLEAAGEPHSPFRQPIDIRCVCLATVTADVTVGAVIGDNEKKIRLSVLLGLLSHRARWSRQEKKYGESGGKS